MERLRFFLEKTAMKWRYVGKYIDGEPTIVIADGKILEGELKKIEYRISDILQLLRNKEIFDLNQVKFAILESNGQISILKKAEYQPLTPKDMNISVSPVDMGTEIIYDGIIVDQNLKQFNKNRKWLMKELKKQGIKDASEVFLATLDSSGNFYIDKYADHIKNLVDIGDYKGPY